MWSCSWTLQTKIKKYKTTCKNVCLFNTNRCLLFYILKSKCQNANSIKTVTPVLKLCLHHPERSIQGPPPPPPRSLRPHHCHANACYRPLVKVIKPIHKQIQVWPEGSSEALQDCSTPLTGICLSRLHIQQYYRPPRVHWDCHCLHHQVHWWCNGHKDYHCLGQPEAVADRGGLQTSEGSERCL